ncbi:MAG: glycosyltransferase family 2 protein [Chlorobia bacterium]|nr:glycosyltransferase family 2 protein [Fimbriimonadaceae bacterium]
MGMAVSILLCTRDRAPDLRATLQSLATISVPKGIEAEVIVIDNGSSDATQEIVKDSQFDWATPHWILEPNAGQSNARNRGLAEAKGEVLCFVDDDLRFRSDWLAALLEPFELGADAVAGCISLAPHLQKPWMTPKHETMFASTRPAEARGEVGLTGANMAFSRAVLDKVPGFDPNIGPGRLGFCDDVLFSDQILQAGVKMLRASASIVEHHFRPDRLERKNLLKAAYAQGRSLAYIAYHWGHDEVVSSVWSKLRAKLGYRRRQANGSAPSELGAEPFELNYHVSNGYWNQLAEEMKCPRRYEKRGLRPILRP